jgi:hypothetical protein
MDREQFKSRKEKTFLDAMGPMERWDEVFLPEDQQWGGGGEQMPQEDSGGLQRLYSKRNVGGIWGTLCWS